MSDSQVTDLMKGERREASRYVERASGSLLYLQSKNIKCDAALEALNNARMAILEIDLGD